MKNNLRASGIKYPDYDGEVKPASDMGLKRVPLKRLVARLDLTRYTNPAPIYEEPINAKEVDIKLSQHVGKPAIPVVKVNDLVEEGDLIARYDETSLSVNIHASIKGKAENVTDINRMKADIEVNGKTQELNFLIALIDPKMSGIYHIPNGMGIDGRLRAVGTRYTADMTLHEGKGNPCAEEKNRCRASGCFRGLNQ